MNEITTEEPCGPWWDDDLLERWKYARFLTGYLTSRTVNGDGSGRPFAIALDSEWGGGKSFFIERWRHDLQNADPPHLTLHFDAWKEDVGSDPLIAFLGEFKSALDKGLSTLDIGHRLGRAVEDAPKGAGKRLLDAARAVGKLVVKGVVRKTLATGVDEISDAFQAAGNEAAEEKDSGKEESLLDADKLIDALFSQQIERKKIIVEFKGAVVSALREMVDHGGYKLPMFVFIDELDRCRPGYAIALLEGVKHVFDIPGVCFVVATNLEQLGHSTQAIYGHQFDGQLYLKRFFNSEWTLPRPMRKRYIELIVGAHDVLRGDRVWTGDGGYYANNEQSQALSVVGALEWVFGACDLDLRSSERVVEMIAAAASGIAESRKIHLLWLAVLCVIRYLGKDLWTGVVQMRNDESVDFVEKFRTMFFADGVLYWKSPIPVRDRSDEKVTVSSIYMAYIKTVKNDVGVIRQRTREMNPYANGVSWVEHLSAAIDEEAVANQDSLSRRSFLYSYLDLVQQAGHLHR